MRALFRDLRYSLRGLARNPAFAAVVILLLAVGIGANTLIFTAVDVLLLRPLPVKNPEQLVRLVTIRPNNYIDPMFGYLYCRLLRERVKTFSVFAAGGLEMSFQSGDQVENVAGQFVSGNYYRTLGINAFLGRLTTDADEEASPYPVVLSYGFWQRVFGGRTDVLGRSIRLRGFPFTIVGVLPRGFNGIQIEDSPDVRIPISAHKLWITKPGPVGPVVQIFGRLKDGISRAQARAEFESLYPWLIVAEVQLTRPFLPPDQPQDWVAAWKSFHPDIEPMARGLSSLRKQFSLAVQALMGAVGVLLILVCVNIAGLLLARGEARRKEIAVRMSLGASRWAAARQLLMDGVVLSALGAAGGLIIARTFGPMLMHFLPARRPLALQLDVDARVLGFAVAACLLTALIVTVAPCLQMFRTDLSSLMARGGARVRTSQTGHALMALQVALSTLLLIGGVALSRTLVLLRTADAGFKRERLVVMVLNPRMAGAKSEQLKSLFDEILRRARSLPGVAGVSLAEAPLMRGVGLKVTVAPTGTRTVNADFLNASINYVSLGHFANIGLRVIAGRDFLPGDAGDRKPRPAIVSQSFAKRFYPNLDAIGRTFGDELNAVEKPGNEIVGVVSDAKYRSMRDQAPPTYYELIDDELKESDGVALYVRTRGDSGLVTGELRRMLARVGQGIAPWEVATMEQEIETSLWQERLIAALSATFATLSAVLVAIGLYGMLGYSVARRTRELGIRVALGARVRHIASLIGRDVLWSVAPGLSLGLVSYAACVRFIRPLLYGMEPFDARSITAAVVLLTIVAGVAASGPTWRAVRIEPTEALREE